MKHLIPRKYDRSRFLVDVHVRCLNRDGQFQAHGIDLGQSGISLFTKRFVSVGESVELEFRRERPANGPHGCKIIGSIAYARVESDGNILGIAFARALNPQEIQALRTPAGAG